MPSTPLKVTPVAIQWHPELSIYASKVFLKAVGDEFGWLAGMDESGNQRCMLPYTVVRKAMLRMVRFRVETIPLAEDFSIEEERRFLNAVVSYLGSAGFDVIIPASTNTIFRTYPEGADAAPYGTHIIDLTQPEEVLWNNMHSKHRNVVRNAAKKGVQIRRGLEFADRAFDLVVTTFKRSALPFMDKNTFRRVIDGLGENVEVFVAEHEGKLQACAVVPFSQHSAYYVYGGTIAEPLTGAANLLQWEAIRHFRQLGVRRYDFCGARIKPEPRSKAAGLIMFKERFGAELHQGYMWKIALRPLKAAFYSLGVRWLRGGDIVDHERHKLNSYAPLVEDGAVSGHGGLEE